jgi:protein-tyrosine-phosphatase
MAEAFLAHTTGDRADGASAGSHPKELHPNAVRAMREYGIDIAGRRTKHLDEFAGSRFDHVVTLCDKVREVCPEFPGGPEATHWSIPDPAAETGLLPFRRVAADIHTRVEFLARRIAAATTKR